MPWAWADSRWRALIHAALVLTAWSLFTRPAPCADATFALTWRSEAKTPCVTENALRAGVARKLGRAPFADQERAEIVIEGEEHALDGERWRARIAERDRHGVLLGEREITAKSCESLRRAATFVVALFTDPDRDEGPTSDEEAPASVREEPPPAVVPPPPPPPTRSLDAQRPPSRGPSGFDLRLGLGASVGTGLLPSMNGSLLATARLEQRSSPWSFDWTGVYSWPQSIAHGTIHGDFAAVEQRARACLALIDGAATRLDACGGAMWGAIIPQTTGVLAASGAWRRLVGPTAALALEIRAAGKAARLEVGVDVPLGRYEFNYLSNLGQTKLFYTSSSLVVFVGLSGLQTILP